MNNKAFGNLFCNSQKSFYTSPGSSDSINRGYRSFFKLNNSIYIYKHPRRNFFFCKCHCWVWRMIDKVYYSSRKVPGRCENSFVNYRIKYQKLCDLMRPITKELNWPTVQWFAWAHAYLDNLSSEGKLQCSGNLRILLRAHKSKCKHYNDMVKKYLLTIF